MGGIQPAGEDVAMLTSLPLFGMAHATNFYWNIKDKKRIEALKTSLSKLKYSTNKITYLLWAKYFEEGYGMNSPAMDEQPYKMDSFLAYWLSYYVFPSLPEDGLSQFCIPDQRCLLKRMVGTGTMVLGFHICTSRRVLKERPSVGRAIQSGDLLRKPLRQPAPLGKVQSTIPDACWILASQAPTLKGGWEGQDVPLEVSRAGVIWVTWPESPRKPLTQIINDEGSYSFRPYAYTPRGSCQIFFMLSREGWSHWSRGRAHLLASIFLLGLTLIPLPSKLEQEFMVTYSP